jgi:hypothetical protein
LQRQFNTILDVEGNSLSFTFTRIYTPQGAKYFVTVTKDHQPYCFDMKQNKGNWSIADPAPPWIKALEHKLSERIIQNDV